ncbi:hypothetical protein [Hamadaea tsunoensis]|uniref:hypothetical protein n=1 Tax=Hamadaea tsunoensis TaxID=53368 RepID=UPI000420FAA4|nr:hypothetical protein [Hamadaea tsunoensis]
MRITATAVTLFAGLALLAGCDKSGTPSTAASAQTDVSASSSASAESPAPVAPSSAASASPAGCGLSGTASGGSGPAAQFMKAWLKCDAATEKSLTEAGAYAQVQAIGVPKLDMTWSYVGCDGAMGSSYCTYRNKLGSDMIIKLHNETNKIAEVKLDATVYYTDAEKYAREFLDAFTNHNKPRMVALASQSIVDSVVVDAPPAGYNLTKAPDDAKTFNAQFTATGEYWIVTVHGALGKAHAVTYFGNAG